MLLLIWFSFQTFSAEETNHFSSGKKIKKKNCIISEVVVFVVYISTSCFIWDLILPTTKKEKDNYSETTLSVSISSVTCLHTQKCEFLVFYPWHQRLFGDVRKHRNQTKHGKNHAKKVSVMLTKLIKLMLNQQYFQLQNSYSGSCSFYLFQTLKK